MALAVSLTAWSTPALAESNAETTQTAEEAAEARFPLTPEGAAAFVASVEAEYADFSKTYAHVSWLQATNINHDSNTLASQYGAQLTLMSVGFATEAARFAEVEGLDPVVERKLAMLRYGISLPAPARALRPVAGHPGGHRYRGSRPHPLRTASGGIRVRGPRPRGSRHPVVPQTR